MNTPVLMAFDRRRPAPLAWASVLTDLARHRYAGSKEQDRAAAKFFATFALKMREVELFDFGEVDDLILREESKRGGDLWEHGFLRTPYDTVAFHYDLIVNPAEAPEDIRLMHYTTLICIEEQPRSGGPPAIMAADFIVLKPDGPMPRALHGIDWPACSHAHLLVHAGAFYPRAKGEPWTGITVDTFIDDPQDHDKGLQALGEGVLGLSMICSTRGIDMRREEAPHKLNAKRAKSNKPPLPAITYVHTARYFEAARNVRLGGTHASPVPHLRRGHIRHYGDGRQVWIRDQLVNCKSRDEISKVRDHYEIEA